MRGSPAWSIACAPWWWAGNTTRPTRGREGQIDRHRRRAHLVLRACQLLYGGLGAFVGTSLALAGDAFLGFRLGVLPTSGDPRRVVPARASILLGSEVSLSVRSFDLEMDQEMKRKHLLAAAI